MVVMDLLRCALNGEQYVVPRPKHDRDTDSCLNRAQIKEIYNGSDETCLENLVL